jgi:hypothetical protein
MAFDEDLAERVRERLARTRGVEEKRMFGGCPPSHARVSRGKRRLRRLRVCDRCPGEGIVRSLPAMRSGFR